MITEAVAIGMLGWAPATLAAWPVSKATGVSELMREVRKNIVIAAGLDLSVLIIGEPGTGKEFVARSIHNANSRKRSK